jgi:hypothetical protein
MKRVGALGLAFIAAVALGLGLAALAEPAPARATPSSDPAKPAPAPDLRRIPPMVFFLAKGEAGACGPDCSEWIAADGAIDAATPQRLRALLAKIHKAGKRTPPIYFFSPGGSVDASLELGRLMRANKIKAGVARTVPQGCDPTKIRDKACDAIMRSGRELDAELRANRATCASSCVYALIGAAEREVPPGAALGVHSMQMTRTMVRMNQEGRVLSTTRTWITGNTPDIRDAHERVARYAAQMGIGRALIDAAAAIPFQSVRALTRAEIIRFGIDTREFAESSWMREANPTSGRVGLTKFMIGADADEPQQYRMSLMRLSCASSAKTILVQLAREQNPFAKPRSVALVVGGKELVLKSFGKPSIDSKGSEMQVRGARAAPADFENALRGESIELVEEGAAAGGAKRRTAVSLAGLASLLKALPEQCYQGAASSIGGWPHSRCVFNLLAEPLHPTSQFPPRIAHRTWAKMPCARPHDAKLTHNDQHQGRSSIFRPHGVGRPMLARWARRVSKASTIAG